MTFDINQDADPELVKAAFGLDVGETSSPTNHLDMPKPYINLGNNFPGIASLLMFDRQVAKPLTQLAEVIMRRTNRSLDPWFRELLGAFVSKLNDCQFCYQSHMSAAAALGDPETVKAFLVDQDSSVLTDRQNALMSIAVEVNHFENWDRNNVPYTIEVAKRLSCSEQDIYDTVLVASFFAMCNRYVLALGTTFQPGEPEVGGKNLVKYGYRMNPRRFFGEILPRLWNNLFRG